MSSAATGYRFMHRKCSVCGAKPGEECDTVQQGAWHQAREGFWRTLLATANEGIDLHGV